MVQLDWEGATYVGRMVLQRYRSQKGEILYDNPILPISSLPRSH